MLQYVEAGNRAEDLRLDVLQAIRFIIQAWDDVDANVIRNCWRHTKILPDASVDSSEDIRQQENLVFSDIANTLQALNLSHPMQAEEFLNIPDESVVYEVPKDDQIIEELVYLFGDTDKENVDLEETDDSNEKPIISTNVAISSLENVHTFLLQQDNAEEYIKLVRKVENFLRFKKTTSMQQANIDAYFR